MDKVWDRKNLLESIKYGAVFLKFTFPNQLHYLRTSGRYDTLYILYIVIDYATYFSNME